MEACTNINASTSIDSNTTEISIDGACNNASDEKTGATIDFGPSQTRSLLPSASTSGGNRNDRGTGKRPLTSLTILIGSKRLRLKEEGVIDERDDGGDEMTVNRNGTSEGEDDDQRQQSFDCDHCAVAFLSAKELQKHILETHGSQRPFSCPRCGKCFTHRESLTLHERIHTGEKPFQCPVCNKCFARQTNYNIHMKLHASGRRYFCSFCGKWYRTETDMLDHQQNCLALLHGTRSSNDDKPLRYQCSYCEKMFHHRRDKNIHERTHTGERPFACGYCSKGFTQSQALTIHIRTHTGERPYLCGVCHRDFRDSSALRKHEFVKHTSIRANMTGYGPLGSIDGAESLQPIYVDHQQNADYFIDAASLSS